MTLRRTKSAEMNKEHWIEIRPVPKDPEILRPLVTEAEWETAAAMQSVSRRAEWLSWRAVARERLGRETTITYDTNGAPLLKEGRGWLSVSHTRGWVALVWSPRRCAVDMEHASRDVSKVSARFISETERELDDAAGPLFPISVWCAKEALYKYTGVPGLDFMGDLRITASDIAAGRMAGTVKGGEAVEIGLLFRDGLVIAVIY